MKSISYNKKWGTERICTREDPTGFCLASLALVFVLPGTFFLDTYLAVPLSPLSLFKLHVFHGASPTTVFKIANLPLHAPWHNKPFTNFIFSLST